MNSYYNASPESGISHMTISGEPYLSIRPAILISVNATIKEGSNGTLESPYDLD